MSVPATRMDLIPPVGAGAGLPLTLVWADDLTDAGGAGTEEYALFDTTLWQTASGNRVSPAVPMVVSGSPISSPQQTLTNLDDFNFLGLTMETDAPRLNFGTGWLEHGQAMQDIGNGRHDAGHQRTFYPAATSTITESGKFVEHPRRAHTAARPANHTWQQPRHNTLKRALPSYDLQLGSQIDEISGSIDTVEAITHRTAVDLPSNGIGATYGDRHNSAYLSSMWSAPLYDMTTPTGLFQTANEDGKGFSAHWGMNLMVNQEVLASGTPLSSPDSVDTAAAHGLIDGDSLLLPSETMQTICVKDIHSDSTITTPEQLFPLGRVDLGNHMVSDTCGLIGYEGIISASAFTSVSRHSNPPDVAGATPVVTAWNQNGVGTFSGINIQVHSGMSLRRNGASWNYACEKLFRYGSDGTFVEPMTEGMSTTGIRSGFQGSVFTQQTNQTRFHTGRTNHITTGASQANLEPPEWQEANVFGVAHPTCKSSTKGPSAYILGDTHSSGTWTATLELSQEFLKDKIPTKVKVVPSLIGYEEVSVAAGASHPSSTANTFKKPIVDYHVIVSLSPIDRLNASVDLNNSNIGNPTIRNAPSSNRLTVNMNLEDEACEIYHAVFRINPDNLERIYFDPVSPSCISLGVNTADSEMSNSVVPRHDSENGGWGLHQMTPFRPLVNTSWAQIPLLCATIESGGFYQRGGIGHLWDADVYGNQLFVGADIIDATHLESNIFGNGQVWADGTGDLGLPRGSELMIFKYDPSVDPYHTIKQTTATDNPLYATVQISTQTDFINTVQTGGFPILGDRRKQYEGWEVHDWVFPQIELMRYLGREDKGNAMHPRHSNNPSGNPMFHPTLHCASLRFMDDGRMAMATIHRDYIGSEEEYPSNEVAYPFNPDVGSGSGCPAGYYRSGDQCIPINTGDDPSNPTQHLDPITGELIDGPPPSPSNGSGTSHTGGGDNFSPYPSWSRILANTSARSLLLMWSDAKAVNGKVNGGRKLFQAESERIDASTYYTQNWTFNDTWWSGSRISYWYPESGQRAIPITYGSYPESRMSCANLPKCLPHIMTSGIVHGYPLLQPIDRVSTIGLLRDFTGTDVWAQTRYDYLKRTRFVPTTIGFADFGAGANPHQELGWSGWSFPHGLYDPIGFGNNTDFFSDDPAAVFAGGTGVALTTPTTQKPWSGFGSSIQYGHMEGPMSAISHHGPLHYGISSSHHPFKVDRIWKQVHGGVGYDIPLHLLAPADVSVRARAGARNSLDIEMETPFHRTETLHLDGAAGVNVGFDLGGKSTPSATRTHLGQYYLRTNLWDDASRTQAGNTLTGGLIPSDRVRGPLVSGSNLEAFWSDHPTDHFHAGAIPIMPNNDYDLETIENERYAPAILGRIDEISELDYVSMAEQLQSSVDVHVNSNVRPMWDSGSIVSGRGTGARDSVKASLVSQNRGELIGDEVRTALLARTTKHDDGLGKGQRLLRTDDGTLHIFNIERSGRVGSNNNPAWTHYTKPLHNDVFWNRKAMKANPENATYDGKDEVGPMISASDILRGSAFASDSNGTIHAIIEVENSSIHRLYYTYAKRRLKSYNPTPVYEWDWSEHTPVIIDNTGEVPYDLRQPSLVCDSHDRLHLACRLVGTSSNEESYIIYSTKLITDASFIDLPEYDGTFPPTEWTETRWSAVSKSLSPYTVADDNSASNTSHANKDHDAPKVCLTGEGLPVVFFRGASDNETILGDRANTAIYVNKGKPFTTENPSGRFSFDSSLAIHVVGVNLGQEPAYHSLYYDAIIDETDRAYVTVIKGDVGRSTYVTTFTTSGTLADQYSTTNGLGVTKSLFIPKDAFVEPNYQHITTTVNGEGQLHMILGFTLGGTNADYAGEVFRDDANESTIAPLQWPTMPSSEHNLTPPAGLFDGKGGYSVPAGTHEWPDGGTFSQPLSGEITHFMEVWMPTFEFSQSDGVIRSINVRWLSLPSMAWDATNGWYPVASAQSLSGHEDFTHTWPQLRFQRFWGYDASELDLKWSTNEMSWMTTPHGGSRLYYPYSGGASLTVGEGNINGEGVAGWP